MRSVCRGRGRLRLNRWSCCHYCLNHCIRHALKGVDVQQELWQLIMAAFVYSEIKRGGIGVFVLLVFVRPHRHHDEVSRRYLGAA